MKRAIAFAALAAIVALAGPARASDRDPVNDPALIARARAEGSVSLYSSVSVADLNKLAQRFEKTYGVRVDVLRLESNTLPARITIEARGGNGHADAVLTPTLQMYALKSAGILAHASLPETRDFLAQTVDRDGLFAAVLINTDTIVYNPAKLAAAHLTIPKNWSDLTRPEWRGQFAMYSHSYEWFLAMKKALGAGPALALMRGLAANEPHLVASYQLALTQTGDGEFVAAANAFGYDAEREKRAGRPLDFVNAPPTIAEINAIGVVAAAPHPNAARLFARWTLARETQQFVVSTLGRSSGRKDVRPDPATWNRTMQIIISDPTSGVDYQAAAREFDELFRPRG